MEDQQIGQESPAPMEQEGPTPDQAMASMEDERMAQVEAIAAASPQIEKPIKASVVVKLVKEVNKLIGKIDESMVEVEYSEEGSNIQGQCLETNNCLSACKSQWKK